MRKAFTLIELSIAMLILGLLISGVLVANKMQQSAKMQKLIKEVKQLEQAIIDFRAQYNAIPGSYRMHKQLADYPELGGTAIYKDIINSTFRPFWSTDPNAISMFNRFMTANSMLQMKLASGGAYPSIPVTDVTVRYSTDTPVFEDSITKYNFPDASFGKNSILVASYISTKNNFYTDNSNSILNASALCLYSKCSQDIPDKITPFVDRHNIYLMQWDLSPSISVSDSVKLSTKFDTGSPIGIKMNFGADRNFYNKCTTATSGTFGNNQNQIGYNTKFLNNENYNDILKGCVVAFITAID